MDNLSDVFGHCVDGSEYPAVYTDDSRACQYVMDWQLAEYGNGLEYLEDRQPMGSHNRCIAADWCLFTRTAANRADDAGGGMRQ